MAFETTVKKFFPDRSFGFLNNPKGGKDIFFRLSGCFKDFLGELIPEAPATPLTKGTTVKVLKKCETRDGPRATKWTLP